jgi:hypothetical protein
VTACVLCVCACLSRALCCVDENDSRRFCVAWLLCLAATFAAASSATAANASANATAVAVFDTVVTAVVVVRSLFVAIISYLWAAHPPCFNIYIPG